MKILTLTHEYPPVGGGGGRVAQDLAEGLAARGHQVTVLTSALKGLPAAETRAGVHILRLWAARREAFRASFVSMLVYDLHAVWRGWRLARAERPDLIHVHFAVPAGAAAWALSRLTGLPYLLTVHMGDIPGGVPSKTAGWFRFVKPFTHPVWRGAARVVSVSSHGKRLAARHYDVPVTVIPNGIRLETIPQSGRLQDPPRLAFVGRFMEEKNPLGLAQALALVRDLPWQAVFVGDGPQRAAVEEVIAAAGLTERVCFTGWVQPEQALAEIAASDVLVIPSFSEGLPVVAVQALGAGVALAATRVGSLDDVVQPGENGLLVDEPSPAALADALRRLLADREQLAGMKAASRRRAAAFDLTQIVARYEALMEQIRP